MTNLFAMYLAVIFGIVLFIAGIWLKKMYIMIPCGLAWVLVSVYCVGVARAGNLLYVWGFSGFAFIMAVFSFASINTFRDKRGPPIRKTEDDIAHEELEDIYKERERHASYRKR